MFKKLLASVFATIVVSFAAYVLVGKLAPLLLSISRWYQYTYLQHSFWTTVLGGNSFGIAWTACWVSASLLVLIFIIKLKQEWRPRNRV